MVGAATLGLALAVSCGEEADMFGFVWKVEAFIAAMALLGIAGIIVGLFADGF